LQLAISFGGYYAPVQKYVEAAELSESGGVGSIWLPDSQMLHRDVYACLSLCAASTKRARLGTAVTNPMTRDPTVTASAISTIDEISNGRAILGIGPGDSSVRRIGGHPASVSQLESVISKIRSSIRGEEFLSADGERVSMRWSKRDIPIFISATGPRMLELGGRIGDGVIVNVGTGEKATHKALSAVKKGEADRQDGRRCQIADLSFINISEDRKAAVESARPYVVWYLKNARHLFQENGLQLGAELGADVEAKYVEHDHIHTIDWNSASDRSKFIPDDMVNNFAIAGTAEDCVRKIREKERLGVEVFIARHTGDEREWENFLKIYLEHVVPEFQ
jgi:5,10-methylenetetrahydromethanopterin reductase